MFEFLKHHPDTSLICKISEVFPLHFLPLGETQTPNKCLIGIRDNPGWIGFEKSIMQCIQYDFQCLLRCNQVFFGSLLLADVIELDQPTGCIIQVVANVGDVDIEYAIGCREGDL